MTQDDAAAELRVAQLASSPVETARRMIEMQRALAIIARGRTDCGRPLAAEVARQTAREVLSRFGSGWGG